MARQTAPARPKASSLAQGRSALFRVTALLPAGAFRSPKNQTPSAERTALLPRKGLFVTLCCTIISLGNLFFLACQPGMRFWTNASDSAIFRIGWQKSGNSAAPLSLPGGLVTKKFSVTLHPLKITRTRQRRHASLLPPPRTPVAHRSDIRPSIPAEAGPPQTGVFPVIPVFTSAGSARGKMRQISRASGATRKETEYSVQIPISKVFLEIAPLEKTWNKISAERIVHFFPILSLKRRQHNSGKLLPTAVRLWKCSQPTVNSHRRNCHEIQRYGHRCPH